jgi:hypothetical protein
MNYTPRTVWVGGKHSGALPKHLHHPEPKVVGANMSRPQERTAKNEILAFVRAHGPVSIAATAVALCRTKQGVNAHLLELEKEKIVVKEPRAVVGSNQKQMFYSGVQ